MSKKYLYENLILIFVVIIMVAGFIITKNYLIEIITGKIEAIELGQKKILKTEIKNMAEEGFTFPLFENEQYLDLEEFIGWPLEGIDNKGNPEPFKNTSSCFDGSC